MKNKIFITGDTHGSLDIHKLISSEFSEGNNLTKNDYVIIAGDFGLLWGGPFQKENDWWLNWLNKKPWTTLFVAGNHENYEMINGLKTVKMFGSDVGKVNDSVFHLRHGRIYDINKNKILTIGGAESIDKDFRIEGYSWWREEIITKREEDRILNELELIDEVDYIITHTCPESIFNYMFPLSQKAGDPTFKFLDFINNKLKFKHWYFGHFHQDINFHKFTCLYNEIVNIGTTVDSKIP